LIVSLGWLTTAAAFCAPAARPAGNKAILVLTQGNGRQRSFIEFTSGLQQNLTTNLHQPLMVYIENLDFEHSSSPDYRRAIIDWLRTKYRDSSWMPSSPKTNRRPTSPPIPRPAPAPSSD